MDHKKSRGRSTVIKLFQTNVRVDGVTYVNTVQSSLQCSRHFQDRNESLSFNYRSGNRTCELSRNYPENFTTADKGCGVYSKIVDGSWAEWMYWGTCTVNCGGGTRKRIRACTNPIPSNGGALCPNQSTENEVCNIQSCIEGTRNGNYFISTSQVAWEEDGTTVIYSSRFSFQIGCEEMSGGLVILEDQVEQDFVESIVTSMNHWIGMRCSSGMNCTWIDGRKTDDGFLNWADGEPSGTDCIWIGLNGNQWDDTNCDRLKAFLCEF